MSDFVAGRHVWLDGRLFNEGDDLPDAVVAAHDVEQAVAVGAFRAKTKTALADVAPEPVPEAVPAPEVLQEHAAQS